MDDLVGRCVERIGRRGDREGVVGLAKAEACKAREREVAKLEGKQDQATAKVVTQAQPEAGDFAKLVAWVSMGSLRPEAGDFEML